MKSRKQGGTRLEGRQFKERQIKKTIWGESSQTDSRREMFRARGKEEKKKLFQKCEPYKQSACKFPNTIYKNVINVLSKQKLSPSHYLEAFRFSLILIQMLMSARRAAAPGTSLLMLLLSIRIKQEMWVVVVFCFRQLGSQDRAVDGLTKDRLKHQAEAACGC